MAAISQWLVEHWAWFTGAALGWMLATLIMAWRNNLNVQRGFEVGLDQGSRAQRVSKQIFDERLDIKSRELSLLQGRHQVLENEHRQSTGTAIAQQQELAQQQAQVAALNARLEAERRAFAEKEKVFTDASAALRQEFQLLAQRIFTSQGEAQEQKITHLLQPFREQLGDFRRRVDEVYQVDTKERASLLTEVKNLHSASERINREAENLTKALKGDKKLQGNWGELVLERVLEDSNLRKDQDYLLQPARRNEAGDLKRPDVIVRLPQGKDIIVDSKLSLLAYERAITTDDATLQAAAISEHVSNLRVHAKRLAAQDYDSLTDVRSLDFVLMFVPIESAFALALEHDPKLFNDAFAQKVVMVSPATLMLCLRIIRNLWRFENQDRNAQEIAARAGQLYDKLRGLVEDVEILGKQLQGIDKTVDAINGKLMSGQGNLVRQAERFRELGAVVKKPLSRTVVDASSDTDTG